MNSSYRFKATESGFNVYHRSTLIGEILPSKEASGRHCFYLGCDDRRHPRTYRGKVKAAEALRLGLVNRVVSQDALLAEAEALVRKMIVNGPLALRATLEAVHGGLDHPLREAQEGEAQLFGELCATEDAREGTSAFIEKRAAEFEGR